MDRILEELALEIGPVDIKKFVEIAEKDQTVLGDLYEFAGGVVTAENCQGDVYDYPAILSALRSGEFGTEDEQLLLVHAGHYLRKANRADAQFLYEFLIERGGDFITEDGSGSGPACIFREIARRRA